ncbi:phosphatidate cytidylyltransferase [Ideonella sp.]|jgi:phosphatidate cytidylyltransferase|uniref:phosphatidate cytidylyltransferase n=1 Tax=Ideonella sp. TaxID=1929293 RepID=UPI0037BE31B6
MGWLRELSVDQQISLLFVIVFGVLGLVTLGAFFFSLRERNSSAAARDMRFKRDLRAAWLGATVFWLSWVSGPLGATLLFGLLSFLALREFITLMHTRRSDHRSLLAAFFVVLPLQYALVGNRNFDLFTVFIPVYAFIAIPVISALAGDPERFLERNAKIQWGIMVCVFGLSHAPALLLLDFPQHAGQGAFLVFFLVVVAMVAQVTQEGLSRWLRRRPLARAISRSFSWRAWLLGAVAGALAGTALYWVTPFKPWQAFSMGLIAAGSGLLGEFVMKALKKDVGVRFWGNRTLTHEMPDGSTVTAGSDSAGAVAGSSLSQAGLTGAVGLLDRIAPLAFAAPVFFHSVRWYFQLRG